MKHLVFFLFSIAFCSFFNSSTVSAQVDPSCNGAGAIHGVYYMSCFPRMGVETTDNPRIQRAIDSIPSGRLIFNEGLYTVDNTVVLDANDSFLILEGTSTNVYAGPSSHIKMTAPNKAIFKIGVEVYDVAIRDLGLSATSKTGTIGILAEGANATSAHFEFKNLRISGFNWGIKVEPLPADPSWQFDNVKLDHSFFEDNTVAVHVNSLNSGWRISSIEMVMHSGQVGFDLIGINYSEINSVIANGVLPVPPQPLPLASIRVMKHGNLSINNCVAENVEYDLLVVPGGAVDHQIFLNNNVFLNKVDVSGATVVGVSNQYGISVPQVGATAPQPIARGGSLVYSYGDKFCSEGASNCATGGWQFFTEAVMIASSNQYKNFWSRPSLFENSVDIITNLPFDTENRPLLSVIAPTYAGRPLFRLGQSNFHYTFSRNATTGWLDFNGNQAQPNTGYNFNGPVKLPSFSQSSLPQILESGSLVFCSNCLANTTPCASGGSGALAISIGSQWSCK